MDANEAYTEYHSTLHSWLQQHSLIDIHAALHNLDTNISTYNRGSKRIDYIFGTENIIPYITHGGILSYHFMTSTDHRALYIDMELQKFLRSQPPPTNKLEHRLLQSKQPRGYRKYCKTLETWLDQSTIESTLHKLSNQTGTISDASKEKLQELEQEFTTARLMAERKIPQYGVLPWSPKLKKAQQQVFYYKLWMSQY